MICKIHLPCNWNVAAIYCKSCTLIFESPCIFGLWVKVKIPYVINWACRKQMSLLNTHSSLLKGSNRFEMIGLEPIGLLSNISLWKHYCDFQQILASSVLWAPSFMYTNRTNLKLLDGDSYYNSNIPIQYHRSVR